VEVYLAFLGRKKFATSSFNRSLESVDLKGVGILLKNGQEMGYGAGNAICYVLVLWFAIVLVLGRRIHSLLSPFYPRLVVILYFAFRGLLLSIGTRNENRHWLVSGPEVFSHLWTASVSRDFNF
jgi:hypothetical protein